MPVPPQLLADSEIRPFPELGDSLLEGVAGLKGHSTSTVLHAVEHVRRMRGGSQSHLMRCSDGSYYVVKFQNNPQHRRILVNELLGTFLAARLGLPTTPIAIIDVCEELIVLTPDLCVELRHSRIPCQPGLQFGSLYPADPHQVTLLDFLPDKALLGVENVNEFVGMLVFDTWTCNTDGRQVIFGRLSRTANYRAWMIDQGFCFNAGEWNFPDAPRRCQYPRRAVYGQVRGLESFEPWLDALESEIGEQVLLDIAKTIPPEWYEFDFESLHRLLEQLDRRRGKVRELLWSARKSSPQAFPNWTAKNRTEGETNHVSHNDYSKVVSLSRCDPNDACN